MAKLKLSLISALLFASATHAETLSICFEQWTPYAAQKSSGAFTGVVVERLISSANNNKLNIELSQLPYKRCISLVKRQKIDVALFVPEGGELEIHKKELVNWQIGIATREVVNNRQIFYRTDFSSVIIGRDYTYPPAVINTLKHHNKQIIPHSKYFTNNQEIQSLFEVLINGKADAIVVDVLWARAFKRSSGLEFYVSDWLLGSQPQYAGFSERLSEKKRAILDTLLDSHKKAPEN